MRNKLEDSSILSMVTDYRDEYEQSGFFEHFHLETMHTLKCVIVESLKDSGRRYMLKKLPNEALHAASEGGADGVKSAQKIHLKFNCGHEHDGAPPSSASPPSKECCGPKFEGIDTVCPLENPRLLNQELDLLDLKAVQPWMDLPPQSRQ